MSTDPNQISTDPAWRSHVADVRRRVAAHYQRTGDTTRLARMSARTTDSAAPCATCAKVRATWSAIIARYYAKG